MHFIWWSQILSGKGFWISLIKKKNFNWNGVELFQDLEHQGLYQAEEVIGLSTLVCDECGHQTEYQSRSDDYSVYPMWFDRV